MTISQALAMLDEADLKYVYGQPPPRAWVRRWMRTGKAAPTQTGNVIILESGATIIVRIPR